MTQNNSTLRKAAFYFGLFMVVIYLALGVSILSTNVFYDILPENRTLIGSVILAYSAFRIWMAFRLRKQKPASED